MTKIKEKNVGGHPRHPTWEAFYEGLEMANQSHKWAICKFCPNNKKVRGIIRKFFLGINIEIRHLSIFISIKKSKINEIDNFR